MTQVSSADLGQSLALAAIPGGRTSAAHQRTVIERFPAGHPRGSWPAEQFASARRAEGVPATVVMDLGTDSYLVVTGAVA